MNDLRPTRKTDLIICGIGAAIVAVGAMALNGPDPDPGVRVHPVVTEVPTTTPSMPAKVEDMFGWDCRVDGNRICAPSNTEGVPAGCYSDIGVLVAGWPCHVEVMPDGSSDVYSDPQGSW